MSSDEDRRTIGLMGLATYLPTCAQTAAEIAEASGIPEMIVRDKLGIVAKRLASYEDQTSAMAVRAARVALERAETPEGWRSRRRRQRRAGLYLGRDSVALGKG